MVAGIGESGLGNANYPVIREHIESSNKEFEGYTLFSRNVNAITQNYLVQSIKTQHYYSTLIPLAHNLSALTNPKLGYIFLFSFCF